MNTSCHGYMESVIYRYSRPRYIFLYILVAFVSTSPNLATFLSQQSYITHPCAAFYLLAELTVTTIAKIPSQTNRKMPTNMSNLVIMVCSMQNTRINGSGSSLNVILARYSALKVRFVYFNLINFSISRRSLWISRTVL